MEPCIKSVEMSMRGSSPFGSNKRRPLFNFVNILSQNKSTNLKSTINKGF